MYHSTKKHEHFSQTHGDNPNLIFLHSCPYLHRTTGDTERRYHLRYYKTGTCVHETDARGHCVKNGPHCAFAHGPHDLRQPVYDIREIIAQQDQQPVVSEAPTNGTSGVTTSAPSNPDTSKDKSVFLEDARWQGRIAFLLLLLFFFVVCLVLFCFLCLFVLFCLFVFFQIVECKLG